MAKYLLDTNHLSAAINNDHGFWERLARLHADGNRVGTCAPVLCEYELGLSRTARVEENRQVLRRLLKLVKVWPIEPQLAPYYAAVFFELKSKGRVMSQIDMMLAALARQMQAIIVTTDRDFEALPDIQRQNWLAG